MEPSSARRGFACQENFRVPSWKAACRASRKPIPVRIHAQATPIVTMNFSATAWRGARRVFASRDRHPVVPPLWENVRYATRRRTGVLPFAPAMQPAMTGSSETGPTIATGAFVTSARRRVPSWKAACPASRKPIHARVPAQATPIVTMNSTATAWRDARRVFAFRDRHPVAPLLETVRYASRRRTCVRRGAPAIQTVPTETSAPGRKFATNAAVAFGASRRATRSPVTRNWIPAPT